MAFLDGAWYERQGVMYEHGRKTSGPEIEAACGVDREYFFVSKLLQEEKNMILQHVGKDYSYSNLLLKISFNLI